MKYITIFLMLLGLGGTGFAQQFDRGNNNAYTPFTNFAAPVARPTPLESPPLPGKISNLEKGIATKTVQGAHSCLHFPKGTPGVRSEEHTSELQSLMRISYAVFCLKKKN